MHNSPKSLSNSLQVLLGVGIAITGRGQARVITAYTNSCPILRFSITGASTRLIKDVDVGLLRNIDEHSSKWSVSLSAIKDDVFGRPFWII